MVASILVTPIVVVRTLAKGHRVVLAFTNHHQLHFD